MIKAELMKVAASLAEAACAHVKMEGALESLTKGQSFSLPKRMEVVWNCFTYFYDAVVRAYNDNDPSHGFGHPDHRRPEGPAGPKAGTNDLA